MPVLPRPARLVLVGLLSLVWLGESARANALIDIATSIVNEAYHAPVPAILGPLVTAAENADIVTIGSLEVWFVTRERQIRLQIASADNATYIRLLRQLKAVEEMKSKMAAIKMRRTQEDKQKKEDGWDPFYARYTALGPIVLPGSNSFVLALDGLEDFPGDAPPGPIVALVTPPFAGIVDSYIPVMSGGATAMFTPAGPGMFNVSITAFSQTIGSFDLAPGVPTGPNIASLNEFGSPATGTLNAMGAVDMAWEGKYVNAVHSGRSPILFFAESHGALRPSGEAAMWADDPMIVPMAPGTAPEGAPWLRGAAVYSFDAATMTLRVNENTVVVPAGPPVHPDIAMMRDGEGRYTYRPIEDLAVGAVLFIPPMPYTGMSGAVHTFGDVPFSVSNGLFTLLSGTIRHIKLDPAALIFEGDLDVTPATNPIFSRSCNQIMNAPGPRRIAFASAGAVIDLVVLTETFTVSGRLDFPEIFALEGTGSVACPADLNGDLLVEDADFVIFAGDYNELIVPPASPWSDLDGDGFVDDDDFVIFAADYDELLCL